MYNTIEEIERDLKARSIVNTDYFDVHPKDEFNKLLEALEEETRGVINGEVGGVTLLEETRTDKIKAPNKRGLELNAPIKEIISVKRIFRDKEKEVDENWYNHTRNTLFLQRTRRPRLRRTPHTTTHTRNTNYMTWADLAEIVEVTYKRGYTKEEIPLEVKNVQKEMIARALIHMREDHNLSKVNPDDVESVLRPRELLTENMKDRLARVSWSKNKYTVL